MKNQSQLNYTQTRTQSRAWMLFGITACFALSTASCVPKDEDDEQVVRVGGSSGYDPTPSGAYEPTTLYDTCTEYSRCLSDCNRVRSCRLDCENEASAQAVAEYDVLISCIERNGCWGSDGFSEPSCVAAECESEFTVCYDRPPNYGGGSSGGGSSGGGSSGGGSSGSGASSGEGCTNTCRWANDGECDDGGPGASNSVCQLGSDCSDCGPRNGSSADSQEPMTRLPDCDGSRAGRLCLTEVEIRGDSNTDGVLSPGESAYIAWHTFENTGASDLLGLRGVVSSSSEYVSFPDGQATDFDLGRCNSGRSCQEGSWGNGDGSLNFEIALNTPPDTRINFNFDLVDEYGNTYHLEYWTRVVGDDVTLTLTEVEIRGDSNTDGVLSPGEGAYIAWHTFENTGASDILGLRGVVSSSSQYVSFPDGQATDFDLGRCNSGRSCQEGSWGNGDGSLNFEIALETPPNTPITFNFDLVDEYDNIYHLEYTTRVVDDDVVLRLTEVEIRGDEGTLSPGDSAYIAWHTFENSGASDVLGLRGVVSSSSPYVSFPNGQATDFDLGRCNSGRSCQEGSWGNGDGSLNFEVSPRASNGSPITFVFNMQDDFNNTFCLTYTYQLGRGPIDADQTPCRDRRPDNGGGNNGGGNDGGGNDPSGGR